MNEVTEKAIDDMARAQSLHEGDESDGDLSSASNVTSKVMEAASHFSNRKSLCGLAIDDSKLEKNLLSIMDRLTTLEFQKSNQEATLLQRNKDNRSPKSMDVLLLGLSERLVKIEALVENTASIDEPDTGDMFSDGGASRPKTSEGDKRMALTNQAFSIAQNEASKDHPSIPTITRTIFKELTAMTGRIKRFEDSIQQSKAFQDQKDRAQDELLMMEIQRIDEDIRKRVAHRDLDKLGNRFKNDFDNIRREFEDKLDKQAVRITNEVGMGVRTLRDQVKVINEANRDTMDQLDMRIKHLEKSLGDEMEELEARTRELIEETVYLAVSELRTSTEKNLAAAHEQMTAITSDVSEIKTKQEEMHAEKHGESQKIASDIKDIDDKMREMFEQGGIMAMIEAGSKPAILELDRKLDAELTGISAAVTSASEIAESGRKALADKLKAETEDIRNILENSVNTQLGDLNEGLHRLTSSTTDQLSHLHDDLDKQGSQLAHQCAVLNESVGRAHAGLVETKTFLKTFDDRLSEYQVNNGAKIVEIESRITPLETKAKAAEQSAIALTTRAEETEQYAQELRAAITKCEDGILAGQHATGRVSDEARGHRRAMDSHIQAMTEDIGTKLTEDRTAIVQLELKANEGADICQELKDSFSALVTKESFWDVMEKRTKWHAERLAKHCNDTEAATSASDAPKLSSEATRHMSGHAQRIAKVIAAQADAAVLKEMVGGGVPAASELATLAKLWDELVDERRAFLLDEFIRRVEQVARRGRPKSLSDDHYSAEARNMFLSITRLALRLALSKFARILPSETMLGVRGLAAANGACAACSRPFGRDPGPGDRRAGNPEADNASNNKSRKHGGGDGGETTTYGGGTSVSGASSIGGSTSTGSRNPFKQAAPKKTRSKNGGNSVSSNGNNMLMSSSGGSAGLKMGNLQLGSIGEWDDAGSVSSVASGLTHQSDMPRPGDPVTFPAV